MSSTLTKTLLQALFLSLILSFALGINYLYAWTGPLSTPAPNCTTGDPGCDAPLNVGPYNQTKLANLYVGDPANLATDRGLISYGRVRSALGGIEFPDGTVQTTAAGGAQGLSFSKYLHVREEEPNGIDPAGVTVGSYGTRVLNTVVTNTISGASLSANQITLPTGSYYVDAFASSYSGGRHRAQLYNVTRAMTAVMGTSGYGAASNNEDVTESFIKGVFAVTGASESFDIRHRSVDGGRGGIADAFGSVEYYTPVEIWKLD